MSKKMLVLGAVLALCAPVFAADNSEAKPINPRPEMQQGQKGPHKNFFKGPFDQKNMQQIKAAHEKHKADADQLKELVKEYKKAKEGSKKQIAAKEAITKKLGEMREEQIKNRREKIGEFEQRLNDMKARLAEEEQPEAKEAWLEKMSTSVIENNGKFDPSFKHDFKGHGPHFAGPKGGHEDHILPVPPAKPEEK